MPTSVHNISSPAASPRLLSRWGIVVLLCLPAIAGCAQMAVVGRIFYGDPKKEGIFEQLTGDSLEDGARVALICTAPDTITSEYDMVSIDIQEELTRTMRRRGVEMVDPDDITDALDANGGLFDLQIIADGIDADYLFHVDIEHFSHLAPNSPQLYHGRAIGNVYGYKIREGNEPSAIKHAVQVFEQEFNSEYPGKHPIPADQTPERVFRNRFIGHLSNELGRMFYTFRTNETFSSR